MTDIKRVYYTPREGADFLSITIEEFKRRVNFLRINQLERGNSFVIHSGQLHKIKSYEIIKSQVERLERELSRLRNMLRSIRKL